jgi:DNA-binding CsgD family transcriptional regulator/PAS domain-containing protein
MDSRELDQFSEVVGLIYDGATDPARWTRDILPAIGDYVQVPISLLFTPTLMPQDGGMAFIHGIPQKLVDLYTNRYQSEDVIARVALEKGLMFEGSVFADSDLLPRDKFVASKYYREYLSQNAMAHNLVSFVIGDNSAAGVPATACSMWRREGEEPFTQLDRRRVQLLLPHLSRSFGVLQRLRAAEITVASSLTALDRLPGGVFIVDGRAEVTFANQSARRILDDRDGLSLRKRPNTSGLGEIASSDPRTSAEINAAVKTSIERAPFETPHFSQSVAVPKKSRTGSYILQFSALGRNRVSSSSDPSAVVFVTDTNRKLKVDPQLLRDSYRLTAAEARVAIAAMEHATLQEVADHLEISIETVRVHIKRIYAKLGVDSRARFATVMAGLSGTADG